MKRRSCLALRILLSGLFCFLGSIVSEAQSAPNGKRGLKIDKYIYGVSDPKRAASELERVAVENGRDLDFIAPTKLTLSHTSLEYNPFSISTAQRSFTPNQIAEDGFRSELARLKREGKEDSLLICILQTNRHISLREIISLMKSGITFYEPIAAFASPVKIPAGVALELLNAPYVRWIGEYRSTDKYPLLEEVPPIATCYVESFEGDKPEFRLDLKRLGIEILRYDRILKTYFVSQERKDSPTWLRYGG